MSGASDCFFVSGASGVFLCMMPHMFFRVWCRIFFPVSGASNVFLCLVPHVFFRVWCLRCFFVSGAPDGFFVFGAFHDYS